MSRIQGGRWLNVAASGTRTFTIQESAVMRHLKEKMPSPAKQYPLLWAFFGSAQKNRCLRAIFPQNAFTRADSAASIRLRGDVDSLHDDFPILFADADLRDLSAPSDLQVSRQSTDYPIEWNAVSATEVVHRLYSQVLFLFADIVCIFAEDFHEIDICSFVSDHGAPTTLPPKTRPHLIIIVGLEAFTTWSSTDSSQLLKTFSTVSIFPLMDGELTQDRGYEQLRSLLEMHSHQIHDLRQEYIGQLSTVQLETYLQLAIAHLGRNGEQPFDLVRSSRIDRDVPTDIGTKINDIHRMCIDAGVSNQDCAQFIASALIMDHYRPEMPLMNPRLVFQTFYRAKILLPSSTNSAPPIDLLDSVENAMTIEFTPLRRDAITSLDLRRKFFVSRNRQYSLVKSNRLCLYCLIHAAQHFTPCDHPLCDLCAQRFGIPSVDMEYHFMVDECLLCCTTISMIIEILPPTMDPTILAIDGGGVCGVIPLQFLILIQEYLGKCRLQDFVDLDVGTSSGGLIGLGLDALDLPIQECAQLFHQLCRYVFKQRRAPAFPWLPRFVLGRLRQWYSWWMHDSCYDGSVFDGVLQHLFGHQPLLRSYRRDTSDAIKSSTKFGVVATGIGRKTETVLLGNFNAENGSADDCGGYQLIRPHNIEDEPLLWQAARATAAAPFIFSPVDLPAGSFQDGGLTDNFAGGIARRVSRTIWPSCREPARLLSLGTGSTPSSSHDRLPHFRHSFRDGFLRRIFDAWMTSLDTENKWREMQSQSDQSITGNFRRLNVPLDETSFALDNVSMVEHYCDLVLRYPRSARMAKDAALDLLTARFFFELDALPLTSHLSFWCHGTIRCKGSARPLVEELQRLVPGSLEFVTDLHRLGSLNAERDICPSCDRFCWPVSLLCHDAAQALHIYIKAGRNAKWRINSFPATPGTLIRRQQLDLPFGKADYGRPRHQPCAACDSGRIPFRGRRRRRHSDLTAYEWRRKRVRLN